MKNIFILVVSCVLLACGKHQKQDKEATLKDSIQVVTNDVENRIVDKEGKITIYENRIQDIMLPFEKEEMLQQLKKTFSNMSVTKKMGQQDGPDFPLYELKKGTDNVCFFRMDSEDTLKLNDVYIKESLIKDQYGLCVGDKYQKIKELRKGKVKTYTDYHQHTYAYLDKSNIMYEISGDLSLPDTVDIENLKLTEDQIKDWIIEYIIWRKSEVTQ